MPVAGPVAVGPLAGPCPWCAADAAAGPARWWDVDDHRATAARFPAAEVVVVPGAGHMSVEEAPDAVAAAAVAFAARQR